MRVLDVGANSGLYAMLAGRLAGPDGWRWALEPAPDMFSLLLEIVARPGRCPSLRDGCRGGRQRGDDAPRRRRGLSVTRTATWLPTGRRRPRAGSRPTTLDALEGEHRLAPLDFLKLDVEGGEYFGAARRAGAARGERRARHHVRVGRAVARARRPPSRGRFRLAPSFGFEVYAEGPFPRLAVWSTRPALEGHALGRAGPAPTAASSSRLAICRSRGGAVPDRDTSSGV